MTTRLSSSSLPIEGGLSNAAAAEEHSVTCLLAPTGDALGPGVTMTPNEPAKRKVHAAKAKNRVNSASEWHTLYLIHLTSLLGEMLRKA
ncbi:uncharacterized protein PGTG_05865 [Puccinia graminis f. sp. tritici CRL 75-36-700-3]|uniref:Uncharacterized protein n=1 Tax=Puccinia graminis f. sp. tritici (strain CRL 75-36-700-3 / race SCCL) TaxID=418459 RepID=E3K5X3_PUCGT|nr:uncharacterized protein PGTG_05865 [Puccinia graminis f. sp. tritici CRL 75-36-700-3]EFP79544.2 hypothetical protein PGTG_05865 [Puccinia graminis f. sp. tritici CRL 75-36-700-3]